MSSLPFSPEPRLPIPSERKPDLVAVRVDLALATAHHVDRIAQAKLFAGAKTPVMKVDRAPAFAGFVHHVVANGIGWHESIVP